MSSRIPDTIAEFNTYIDNTDDYQKAGTPSNATRLGLSTQNSTDWSKKRQAWDTQYKKYIDPAQRTSVVTADLNKLMADFRTFALPLLNIVASSLVATNTDAQTFNVVLSTAHKKPSHPTAPIIAEIMADGHAVGGGDVDFKCRTSTDASRASIADGADCVQYAYKIGDPAPANPSDGTTKEISTKASFRFHAGKTGVKMYVFFRWYNTKHPELAGSWGNMLTINL